VGTHGKAAAKFSELMPEDAKSFRKKLADMRLRNFTSDRAAPKK
jgi:hypothetical protein